MNIYYYICHHFRDSIHAPLSQVHENDCSERLLLTSISEKAMQHAKLHTSSTLFGAGRVKPLYNFIMSQVMLTAVDYMEYNRTMARTETLET